jgi:hypothetical protein
VDGKQDDWWKDHHIYKRDRTYAFPNSVLLLQTSPHVADSAYEPTRIVVYPASTFHFSIATLELPSISHSVHPFREGKHSNQAGDLVPACAGELSALKDENKPFISRYFHNKPVLSKEDAARERMIIVDTKWSVNQFLLRRRFI